MEKVKVKCPNCGVILTIAYSPENAEKHLKCPVCDHIGKMEAYRVYNGIDKVEYDETQINTTPVAAIIKLQDLKTGKEYILHPGHHSIGRKTYQSPSKASIPIETDDLGISREHCFIDVIKCRDGLFHSYISNSSNKNSTYINGDLLMDDDKPALQDGDIISSSSTNLRFSCANNNFSRTSEIDDDKTEI